MKVLGSSIALEIPPGTRWHCYQCYLYYRNSISVSTLNTKYSSKTFPHCLESPAQKGLTRLETTPKIQWTWLTRKHDFNPKLPRIAQYAVEPACRKNPLPADGKVLKLFIDWGEKVLRLNVMSYDTLDRWGVMSHYKTPRKGYLSPEI